MFDNNSLLCYNAKVVKLIRESLQIISCLGVPIDDLTERAKEKMAMALLAVGDVKRSADWKNLKDSRRKHALTTREIINFHNTFLEDHINSGSYDDIRRKDLTTGFVSGGTVCWDRDS